MTNSKCSIRSRSLQIIGFLCLGLTALIIGCADRSEFSSADQRALTVAPSFLTGPMALLLTNAGGFSARLTFETRSSWGSTQAISGTLTGAASKLAFLPDAKKSIRAPMIFVWDIFWNNGYALNDVF